MPLVRMADADDADDALPTRCCVADGGVIVRMALADDDDEADPSRPPGGICVSAADAALADDALPTSGCGAAGVIVRIADAEDALDALPA